MGVFGGNAVSRKHCFLVPANKKKKKKTQSFLWDASVDMIVLTWNQALVQKQRGSALQFLEIFQNTILPRLRGKYLCIKVFNISEWM